MALQSKATRMTRQNRVMNNGVVGSQALTAEDQMRLEEANEAIQEMNPALRAVFNDLQGNFQTNCFQCGLQERQHQYVEKVQEYWFPL